MQRLLSHNSPAATTDFEDVVNSESDNDGEGPAHLPSLVIDDLQSSCTGSSGRRQLSNSAVAVVDSRDTGPKSGLNIGGIHVHVQYHDRHALVV